MFNFLARMLEMLTGAYNRSDLRRAQRGEVPKTTIGRLFGLFAWGLDIIQDTTERIRLWDDLDNAKGAALDRLGRNYGVYREGTNDTFFRVLIKIKLISMLASGDIDSILNAAAILYDVEPEKILLTEVFPCKIQLEVNDDDVAPGKKEESVLIRRVIKRIVAAGVGIEVHFRAYRFTEVTVYVAASSSARVYGKSRPQFALPPPSQRTEYVCAANCTRIKIGPIGVDNYGGE